MSHAVRYTKQIKYIMYVKNAWKIKYLLRGGGGYKFIN